MLDHNHRLTGQVAGRIDAVESVADILSSTIDGFHEVMSSLADQYVAGD